MKIALLGNMNNNNFSIMRYFRDLGEDCFLLLFQNDAAGSLSHFHPRNDTWEYDRWSRFIIETDIVNEYPSIIGYPHRLSLPPSRRRIQRALGKYDAYVGSGLAPAIFERCGMRLDIFYPYAVGVEFLASRSEYRTCYKGHGFLTRLAFTYIKRLQVKGILAARACLNGELGVTRAALQSIGRSSLALPIPMYYNREAVSGRSANIDRITADWNNRKFIVLSHARQLWVKPKDTTVVEWASMNKNNDWLIRGFSTFLKKCPESRPLLVLLEYGSDVEAAKDLCYQLGIADYVQWVPKMSRKEIGRLLQLSHIGVGEFLVQPRMLWGGTGWEVLAAGRPLLQAVNFSASEFVTEFGYNLPPILDVKSVDDVARHLCRLSANVVERTYIGKESARWFDENNGIGLARKWLHVLRRATSVAGKV